MNSDQQPPRPSLLNSPGGVRAIPLVKTSASRQDVTSLASSTPAERVRPVNAVRFDPEHRKPRIDDKAYISYLLSYARMLKASDLHLRRDDSPWVRIDGKMQPLPNIGHGPTEDAIDAFCRDALSTDKYDRMRGTRGAGEGRVDGNDTGPIRVQAWRSNNGVNLSMRLLSESVPKLNEL